MTESPFSHFPTECLSSVEQTRYIPWELGLAQTTMSPDL